MIKKESPEGQFLTVCWRAIIGMADTVCEQYRWLLTGIATILALIVANLNSIQGVVDDAYLKTSVCMLVAAVFLASIAYLLSAALKARNEVVNKLEQVLGTSEAQSVLEHMTTDASELRQELCRPFFGPMKWIMVRSAERGALDPFEIEKSSIRLIVWQAYAMWLSMLLAAVALSVLVLGIS
ncbi:MAG TPA: hypothetical protein VIM71_16070 [Lacunisphaera sp.]